MYPDAESQAPGQDGARRRNLADILQLRSIQRALLLYAPLGQDSASRHLDPGCIQVRFSLLGALQPDRLSQAWQMMIDRHPGLRMSLRTVIDRDPLIVVWKQVKAPWTYLDWHGLPADVVAARSANLIDDDRRRGLDLSAEPATRLTVMRRNALLHEVLWTCHHLFIDGWSAAIVVRELLAAYRGLVEPRAPGLMPLRCDYRDYAAWSKSRDQAANAAFWRRALAGAEPLAALPFSAPRTGKRAAPGTAGRCDRHLDVITSSALSEGCSAAGVTANTLIQGAWALLLGAAAGCDDVLFGATLAGRPAELDGVDGVVGMFNSNLPVRVRIDAGAPIGQWLHKIMYTQMAAALHADVDLAAIQEWIGLPANQVPFENLVVVENFPWQSDPTDATVTLRDFRSDLLSAYPLTLSVIPAETWLLHLHFDVDRFDQDAANRILSLLAGLLARLTSDIQAPLTDAISWLRTHGKDLAATPSASGAAAPPERAEDRFCPPRGPTEMRLATIWEEVLGTSAIGVRDDFFALGGNSMGAVRLFALIERRLGRRLPLTTLLEHSTIEDLAKLIEQDSPVAWRSLVPIRSGTTGQPLFCVHAGGEHILFYRHLARHIGQKHPVFGLQPLGLEHSDTPLTTIGALAAHYVDELRTLQPNGPYLLLGYCIGASVSLEMARILNCEGRADTHLIILDSGFWWGAPAASSVLEQGAASRAIRITQKLQAVLHERGLGFLLRLIGRNLAFLCTDYRQTARHWWTMRFGGPEARRALLRESVDQACRQAFQRYRPHPCPVSATLVRTSEYLGIAEKERHLKWHEVIGQLDVRHITGKHQTLLEEPTVAQVAQIVGECMAKNEGSIQPED